ncbi:MAG: tetratricopeptide repeat protein [Phycisphaeraceae bacterium]|nr:tetratricopeptide repeat protein [Phycisphaeraceae bacterium]
MKRAWAIVLVAAVGVSMAWGGGCQRRTSGTVTIPDPGPARYAEALRLAEEAGRAMDAGKKDQAIELYGKSLELSREIAIVWHNLGMLVLERGDRMQAVEMLKNAADLDPDRPTALYNIGLVYADNAQPDKALEYFRKALSRDRLHLPSLRGAAKMGRRLMLADEELLEWTKTALLLEKEPEWRLYFEEEKLRIDGALQALGRTGRF